MINPNLETKLTSEANLFPELNELSKKHQVKQKEIADKYGDEVETHNLDMIKELLEADMGYLADCIKVIMDKEFNAKEIDPEVEADSVNMILTQIIQTAENLTNVSHNRWVEGDVVLTGFPKFEEAKANAPLSLILNNLLS